ncbi:MAG: hypothetical protein JXR51_15280 [Bacteroidales bacterium]|nr:hypothetical protein [Bacteroidales bacterium]MBN2758533.1 hypothetical protein [Bacteroidales bacterium]
MKTNLKIIILFSFLLAIFNSCTKENIEESPSEDWIDGRTVRYTVLVVSAGNTSFKSIMAADSAIVSLIMNNRTYSSATDTNGLATFNNLAAGIAAVNIKYPNHTTANLIVDLSVKTDSVIDSDNLRNSSTMVAMFPLNGQGTANIKGKAFAELNTDLLGLENAPPDLKISSIIESSQLIDFVNHTGSGQILEISYEQTINTTNLNASSEYEINVPAAGSGLKIVIKADDFVYNQINGGIPQRKIYNHNADTISVVSGITYFNDIIFE